ncbi:MAG: phosphate ABC transporter permease [Lyngbya sp.]|nr:phosphate ABC transporter permease [Lyngbya sp.]
MLIPITRQTFEELIPAVATSDQYRYCWGKLSDFLKRLLISAVCGSVLIIIEVAVESDGLQQVLLVLGLIAILYWFWGPVVEASLRNLQCRKYTYCGFWQGKVLDYYITEEVTSEQESVNKRGDLIIIENLERRINVEVGDSKGFTTRIQAPLNRSHKKLHRGQVAQLIVMSYLEDLSRISQVSDLYIPSQNLWVSDYPYLRRDAFVDLSRWMRSQRESRRRSPTAMEG